MNRTATLTLPIVCSCLWSTLAFSQEAQGLDSVIEMLDLRESTLRDALRLISESSNVNIVPSREAGETKVSCYLNAVTVRQAVETIAKTNGLWYRIDDESGIVRVMTGEEFERDLVSFREERTRVFTLLFPNAFEIALALRNLFGDRVSLALDRQMQFEEYRELLQRFQRFDILDRRGQSLGILNGQGGSNRGSQYGQGNVGYGAGGLNSGYNLGYGGGFNGNYNLGTSSPSSRSQLPYNASSGEPLTPDQIQQLQGALGEEPRGEIDPTLLEKLRGKPPSIYVTILRRNNLIAVRSSDDVALEEIERIVRRLDVPTPQVLLEVKVLELDLADDFVSVFDASGAGANASGQFTTGDIAGGSGLVDPGTFLYQYVNDTFQARIQFLQRKNRVVALASPTLLVANNEVARLFIGEERPIVRNISSQTTVNQNSTTTSPNNTIELRPVGTTLLLTPNINADRTVSLRVLQESSDVRKGAAVIPVVTGDGQVVSQPIDVVAARSVSGTVVAKDGLTLALGGLVQESIGDVIEGIPGLMDLPLVGIFFRREQKIRQRRELVVLIRPFVLFTPVEGQQISQELADRLLIHPSAHGLGTPLDTFDPDEAPRSPLASDPLKEVLQFQSGLPGGR